MGKAKTIAGKTFRAERGADGLLRVVKANASSNDTRFALCIDNEDYPASLEKLKVYEAIPDKFADAHGLIRVVDESGEDYLYPAESFIRLSVRGNLKKTLRELTEANAASF